MDNRPVLRYPKTWKCHTFRPTAYADTLAAPEQTPNPDGVDLPVLPADVWFHIMTNLCPECSFRMTLFNKDVNGIIKTRSSELWKEMLIRDLQIPRDAKSREITSNFEWAELYKCAFDGSHSYSLRPVLEHTIRRVDPMKEFKF